MLTGPFLASCWYYALRARPSALDDPSAQARGHRRHVRAPTTRAEVAKLANAILASHAASEMPRHSRSITLVGVAERKRLNGVEAGMQ